MTDKFKYLPRLLLVEDEPNLGATLEETLKEEGYATSWARSQHDAITEINNTVFDIVLLDVGLPDGSGFDIAKVIATKSPTTAVIFLTAYSAPEERIKGLTLGAEDYIVKPFQMQELLLRIRNGLKRSQYRAGLQREALGDIQLERLNVNFSTRQAVVENETVHLTEKEWALLHYLWSKRNHVVARDEILNQIWSNEAFPSTRTIDNVIMRLRRFVEQDPKNPTIILSIRSIGYKIQCN